MGWCKLGDKWAEHDGLHALTDGDHDRNPGQDGGSGERRAR
jgi:hypothetical protein